MAEDGTPDVVGNKHAKVHAFYYCIARRMEQNIHSLVVAGYETSYYYSYYDIHESHRDVSDL